MNMRRAKGYRQQAGRFCTTGCGRNIEWCKEAEARQGSLGSTRIFPAGLAGMPLGLVTLRACALGMLAAFMLLLAGCCDEKTEPAAMGQQLQSLEQANRTLRKQLEESRAQIARLESLLAERTGELEHERQQNVLLARRAELAAQSADYACRQATRKELLLVLLTLVPAGMLVLVGYRLRQQAAQLRLSIAAYRQARQE